MTGYTSDLKGCFEEKIGQPGLSQKEFEALLELSQQASKKLLGEVEQGNLPALSIVNESKDLEELEKVAKDFQSRFDDVLVLGTGGSSLGGQTLASLKGYGLTFKKLSPRLHFLDNVDPKTFETLFEEVDLKKTGVIVISKSGTTPETLCQFLTLLKKFEKGSVKDHFFIITEEKDSPLYRFSKDLNIPFLPHHKGIGGRFSVFSNVGLLPALIAGVNVRAVREGAASVLANASEAISGAATVYGLLKHHNIETTVLLPYCDRLGFFGLWFRQLWAESLGKEGQGLTPIRAMGTVDQHSQLQLYLDGPRDKFYTVLTVDQKSLGDKLPLHAGLEYFENRTIGDLMDAEQTATIEVFKKRGCPMRHIHCKNLDEFCLGALMMHYMLETILVSYLMDINAFDQPAVEDGKILTRQYMKEMD